MNYNRLSEKRSFIRLTDLGQGGPQLSINNTTNRTLRGQVRTASSCSQNAVPARLSPSPCVHAADASAVSHEWCLMVLLTNERGEGHVLKSTLLLLMSAVSLLNWVVIFKQLAEWGVSFLCYLFTVEEP